MVQEARGPCNTGSPCNELRGCDNEVRLRGLEQLFRTYPNRSDIENTRQESASVFQTRIHAYWDRFLVESPLMKTRRVNTFAPLSLSALRTNQGEGPGVRVQPSINQPRLTIAPTGLAPPTLHLVHTPVHLADNGAGQLLCSQRRIQVRLKSLLYSIAHCRLCFVRDSVR